MKKVAFICVHNSCRSQIAEALGKKLAADVFESYSAGTETKPRINPDAVRLMKQVHGIDMEDTQYSKLLSDIPAVDVVITMGCNVQCPFLPCSHREDWGLEDPTGKPDTAFLETIAQIEEKIRDLRQRLKAEAEEARLEAWREEERTAYIHGWDFSHIAGRYSEQEDLPWDYREKILRHLTPEMKLLDIDTGGGEFLLSLKHPYENTGATEGYPPNAALCEQVLLPLGIDFRRADGKGTLPFPEDSFDMVINRHGDFCPEEIRRVLKPGGLFITQQVGAENDRELVELLCGKTPLPFPEQYLAVVSRKFRDAGFRILEEGECFRPIRFFDVGALVWFARIIQWEFPDFAVDTHREGLRKAQSLLEEKGCIEGSIHRFVLTAQKI